ncbi:unnamed protein product, partial [Prorocentrum cordatum]
DWGYDSTSVWADPEEGKVWVGSEIALQVTIDGGTLKVEYGPGWEDWPGVESMDEVCSRTTKAKQVREIELVSQGKWGAWVNGSLSQKIRPHIWFFAVSDCKKVLQNFTHRVRYEARFLQ